MRKTDLDRQMVMSNLSFSRTSYEMSRLGPEGRAAVWAEEQVPHMQGGLTLLAERAGASLLGLQQLREDMFSDSSEVRRWVPLGGALVETYADLDFRIVHWFSVPGAFFDGTALDFWRLSGLRNFPQTSILRKVQYMADHEARLFRWYRSRVSELDVRDEVLGTTAYSRSVGLRSVEGPQHVLVDSPESGVDQLSSWNEELHGSPAGTYDGCTHALGSTARYSGPASFTWVPLDVYEALLAAAPERSSIVVTDEGAYPEFACPHKNHPTKGSTRVHHRAKPVDLRAGL